MKLLLPVIVDIAKSFFDFETKWVKRQQTNEDEQEGCACARGGSGGWQR